MATAAYCSECNGYVWVSAEGGCSNGHPRSCLRDVHDSPDLPTPVGIAPAAQPPTEPSDPAYTAGAAAAVPPIMASQGATPPVGAPPGGMPPQPPPYGDPEYPAGGFPAQGDPLAGAGVGPPGYYMPPRAPVNESNTNNIGVRVGAYLIDFLIIVAAQGFVGFAMGFVIALSVAASGGDPTAAGESIGVTLFLYLTGATIFLGYFIIAEAAWGCTVGKKVFGLRVVDENGEPISWGQSIARNLMRIVDLLFWGLVGLISMGSSSLRQRLGDRVAKTYVVR